MEDGNEAPSGVCAAWVNRQGVVSPVFPLARWAPKSQSWNPRSRVQSPSARQLPPRIVEIGAPNSAGSIARSSILGREAPSQSPSPSFRPAARPRLHRDRSVDPHARPSAGTSSIP